MNKLKTWNPLQEMEEAQNRLNTLFGGFPTFPIRFPKNGGSHESQTEIITGGKA